MSDRMTQINALLLSLPVDTAPERRALAAAGAAGAEKIMVAGGSDAAVLTLLPEPLFQPEDIPGCVVTAEYAQEFSVRVTGPDGESERYRTAGDFRHYWAHRLGDMQECQVTAPMALLGRTGLVFCCLTENTTGLDAAAAGCSGCVLVIPGDAGCLTDAETALCRKLASVWCLGGRTSLVLRQRSPFANDLLIVMAEQYLERNKLAAFAWSDGLPEGMTGAEALTAAVLDLLDRERGSIPDRVTEAALFRVREKLDQACRETEDHAAALRQRAQACRKALEAFQAMCLTEKYSLGSLLTQEDTQRLRKEIQDLFLVLQSRFPEMVEEAVEQLPTAKEDLKNLAGDYLGALIDAFIDQLLDQVTKELLVPRTQERFLTVCRRFRDLAQEYGLEPEKLASQAETEFLRMTEVNVGDFHTGISQAVALAVGKAVRLVLYRILEKIDFLMGYSLVDDIENLVQRGAMELTDHLLPPKMYARSLCKQSLKYLQTLEENLSHQLEDSVIPRLIHMLQEEFDTMTGVYAKQLEIQTAAAEEALAAVDRRKAELTVAGEKLKGFLPVDR